MTYFGRTAALIFSLSETISTHVIVERARGRAAEGEIEWWGFMKQIQGDSIHCDRKPYEK